MNWNQYALKKLLLPVSAITLAIFLAPLEAQAKETKEIEATVPATIQQLEPKAIAPSTTLEISTSPSQVLPREITTSSEVMSAAPIEVAEAPSSGETEYYQTPVEPLAPEVANARDTMPAFTPKATSNNSKSPDIGQNPAVSEPIVANNSSSETSYSVAAAPARFKLDTTATESQTPKTVALNTLPTERSQFERMPVSTTYQISQSDTTIPETTTPPATTPDTTAPSTVPDMTTPPGATPEATTPPATTPTDDPSIDVQVPPVVPGRATRSGSSYIGIGGNIGLGDGDTALGEGSFAVFSKIGLLPTVSVRPAVLFSDDATILVPITYDFNFGAGPTDALGFSAAPYLGAGAAFSTGGGTSVDLLLTAGLDVPLNSQFTATGAVNATVTGDTAIGIVLGIGYNF
jgi:hypothetical protein